MLTLLTVFQQAECWEVSFPEAGFWEETWCSLVWLLCGSDQRCYVKRIKYTWKCCFIGCHHIMIVPGRWSNQLSQVCTLQYQEQVLRGICQCLAPSKVHQDIKITLNDSFFTHHPKFPKKLWCNQTKTSSLSVWIVILPGKHSRSISTQHKPANTEITLSLCVCIIVISPAPETSSFV